VKQVKQVPSGTTLVKSDGESVADEAKAFVLVVTAEQEASGIMYDGSQPFTYTGRAWRPPPRGVWFEVAGKGYAVHAHGAAAGMTWRMRKLMYKTNRRAGKEVISQDYIKKTSTRSLRIAMATILKRKGVPMAEIVENGEWEDEPMARTYIRSMAPLAAERRNLPDVVLGNGGGSVMAPATETAERKYKEKKTSTIKPHGVVSTKIAYYQRRDPGV